MHLATSVGFFREGPNHLQRTSEQMIIEELLSTNVYMFYQRSHKLPMAKGAYTPPGVIRVPGWGFGVGGHEQKNTGPN